MEKKIALYGALDATAEEARDLIGVLLSAVIAHPGSEEWDAAREELESFRLEIERILDDFDWNTGADTTEADEPSDEWLAEYERIHGGLTAPEETAHV